MVDQGQRDSVCEEIVRGKSVRRGQKRQKVGVASYCVNL